MHESVRISMSTLTHQMAPKAYCEGPLHLPKVPRKFLPCLLLLSSPACTSSWVLKSAQHRVVPSIVHTNAVRR